MASELFTARSDFANLGGSIASFQQNALDDQISNNATLQNYGNVSAQLKASIPSSFGDIAFGAYELLGQSKDLISRISKVKSDISALPATIKDSLVKGGNKLGARVEQGKSLVSETGAQLQTTAQEVGDQVVDITNRGVSTAQQTANDLQTVASNTAETLRTTASTTADSLRDTATSATEGLENTALSSIDNLQTSFREFSPGRYISASGRVAPPAPSIESLQASSEVSALPKFSLPPATKRATSTGLADTMAPENVRQTAIRAIDPEETLLPTFDLNLQSYAPRMPSLTGVDIPGVPSLQSAGAMPGDFLRGLTPESLITRPDEQILPQSQAFSDSLQSAGQQGRGALEDVLGAGRGAQQQVATTLASASEQGGALASDLVATGTQAGAKVASTLQTAGAGALDIVKGGVADVAETVAEVSSSFLPVVGEVTALALGGVQIYEGFKDLFDHPSASKPVTVPMPSTANIAQGFQSGI